LDSLKEEASKFARSQASNLGPFRGFRARGHHAFIYLLVGFVVAIGLFLIPNWNCMTRRPACRTIYIPSVARNQHRFATFYRSFAMVMNAQISISAINTVLTSAFVLCMGLPHFVVAVGLTFLCGLFRSSAIF